MMLFCWADLFVISFKMIKMFGKKCVCICCTSLFEHKMGVLPHIVIFALL